MSLTISFLSLKNLAILQYAQKLGKYISHRINIIFAAILISWHCQTKNGILSTTSSKTFRRKDLKISDSYSDHKNSTCQEHGNFMVCREDRKIYQPQKQSNFCNRLGFLNEDRTLTRGFSSTFGQISENFSL